MIKLYCLLNIPEALQDKQPEIFARRRLFYTETLTHSVKTALEGLTINNGFEINLPLWHPNHAGKEIIQISYRFTNPIEHISFGLLPASKGWQPLEQHVVRIGALGEHEGILFQIPLVSWTSIGSAAEVDGWVNDQFDTEKINDPTNGARHKLWLTLNGNYKYSKANHTIVDCQPKSIKAEMVWNEYSISPPMSWTYMAAHPAKLNNRYEQLIYAW